jgi:hypothetical protein
MLSIKLRILGKWGGIIQRVQRVFNCEAYRNVLYAMKMCNFRLTTLDTSLKSLIAHC